MSPASAFLGVVLAVPVVWLSYSLYIARMSGADRELLRSTRRSEGKVRRLWLSLALGAAAFVILQAILSVTVPIAAEVSVRGVLAAAILISSITIGFTVSVRRVYRRDHDRWVRVVAHHEQLTWRECIPLWMIFGAGLVVIVIVGTNP